ncbi:MAG: ATP-grasp domain-containing protein [Nitrospirae bacterium]|nr:ATP-grasp domain-containing protein [Nitrospirota bacterium]
MAITVWFNESFSSIYNVISDIREADTKGLFHILCSHRNPEFLGIAASHVSAVEPSGVTGEGYVEYCLEMCKRYEVKLFLPTRGAIALAQRYVDFIAIGTKLLSCADSNTLDIINNKARLYSNIDPAIVNIPDYKTVTTVSEFEEAVGWLKERHSRLCLKPSVSVHGIGFKILANNITEYDCVMSDTGTKIGIEQMQGALKDKTVFKELMVMQYLEGAERSIDCLADNGSLIRLVIRLKSSELSYIQRFEHNPALTEIAKRLTAALRLNGIYNIQFKDSGSTHYLLEINTRMSGGLHYSTLSGLNIAYWALCLFSGQCTESDIPSPNTGLKIAKIPAAVVLGM